MTKNIDGIIYTDDMMKLLYVFARDQIIHAVIPDDVVEIEHYAFEWCNSIKSVKLPNSITKIGTGALFR